MDPYSEQHIQDPWILVYRSRAHYSSRVTACVHVPFRGPFAHTSRSTIAPECYIPLGCPTRIPTPDHTIPLHGLDGLTQLLNTPPRIVALQSPSRGTLAATSSLCVGISHLLRRLSGTWSQETSSIRHPETLWFCDPEDL